jgi:hypothetical protein
MSGTAATEKSTTPSSSEKVAPEHETALHRVSQSRPGLPTRSQAVLNLPGSRR